MATPILCMIIPITEAPGGPPQPQPPGGIWGPLPGMIALADALLAVPQGQCAVCLAAQTGVAVEQIEPLLRRLGRRVRISVRDDDTCARCREPRRIFRGP